MDSQLFNLYINFREKHNQYMPYLHMPIEIHIMAESKNLCQHIHNTTFPSMLWFSNCSFVGLQKHIPLCLLQELMFIHIHVLTPNFITNRNFNNLIHVIINCDTQRIHSGDHTGPWTPYQFKLGRTFSLKLIKLQLLHIAFLFIQLSCSPHYLIYFRFTEVQ